MTGVRIYTPSNGYRRADAPRLMPSVGFVGGLPVRRTLHNASPTDAQRARAIARNLPVSR